MLAFVYAGADTEYDEERNAKLYKFVRSFASLISLCEYKSCHAKVMFIFVLRSVLWALPTYHTVGIVPPNLSTLRITDTSMPSDNYIYSA